MADEFLKDGKLILFTKNKKGKINKKNTVPIVQKVCILKKLLYLCQAIRK